MKLVLIGLSSSGCPSLESTSCTIPATHTTGDTTLNGLLADAENLSLYALDIQGIGHFCESRERVTILAWASVNQ